LGQVDSLGKGPSRASELVVSDELIDPFFAVVARR
jgi:hypothetical protein